MSETDRDRQRLKILLLYVGVLFSSFIILVSGSGANQTTQQTTETTSTATQPDFAVRSNVNLSYLKQDSSEDDDSHTYHQGQAGGHISAEPYEKGTRSSTAALELRVMLYQYL